MSDESTEFRNPTAQEQRLLDVLIARASEVNLPTDWRATLRVQPMKDGGMGSLHLFPNGRSEEKRLFGRRVSEYQFADVDGTQVIASLNVDQVGRLFELDIWKTDFSPLICVPEHIDDQA
jgi:hypothetical protein